MSHFEDPARTPGTYRKLRMLSKIAGILVILIAILVLFGWLFNITLLKSIRPDTVPMNPVAAIGFIAAGTTLLLQQEEMWGKGQKTAKWLCFFLILIGILKLISLFTGLPIPFDQILFRKQLWSPYLLVYDTIAPNTALNFLLTGLALLYINKETKKGRRPSQFLGIAITLSSLLSLYGYLYGISTLYAVTTHIPMAIHTAFSFLLLGLGILFSRPDKGSMAVVIGENSGQIIFMRFIAFFLPLIYGWLKIQGENSGLFSKEFGTALFAILTYLVSMFFLGRQSALQHKIRQTKREAMDAIKENERRLQSILDHSAANISLKTLLGKYRLVNQQFVKDFGREVGRVLGKTDYDLFPKEIARELNQYDHQIIRTGQPKSFEEKYPQEDGIHTYLTVKFPLFNQDHKMYALGAISTDITRRKRLEEELRQNEERYALALKGTNDGLWDWDIKTNYLYLSDRWKEMLGYNPEEVENSIQAWENMLHPEDRPKTMKTINDYFEKKIPDYVTEFRIQHKDGSYRWMLDRGMALWNDEGKPYRMIGYQTDLTERKRLEGELRKSHQRLFSILDNIGEGVIVVDKDGNLLIFNRRAEEILGTGAVNVPIEKWNETFGFYHADSETYFPIQDNPLFKAIKGETADNVEMLVKNDNFKQAKWIAVTGRPVKDANQEVIAGVVIFREITLRKQLEKRFRDNEKRMKLILGSIGEGIVIIDDHEQILLINKKAEDILGEAPRQLQLSQWPAYFGIHQADGTALLAPENLPLYQALHSKEVLPTEVLIRNENMPQGRNIDLHGRAVKNRKGMINGAILALKDITEQRQLEDYLKNIEDQFLQFLQDQRPSS